MHYFCDTIAFFFLLQGFIHEQAGNAIMNRLVNDLEDSHSSGHALPNNVQVLCFILDKYIESNCANVLRLIYNILQQLRSVGSARTKETHLNSVLPNQQTLAKVSC